MVVQPQGGVRFYTVNELDAHDTNAVQARVRQRILRAHRRRGLIDKDDRRAGVATASTPAPLLRGIGSQRALACRRHRPGTRGRNDTVLGAGESFRRRVHQDTASFSRPLLLGDTART
jgi:hypothetical protein